MGIARAAGGRVLRRFSLAIRGAGGPMLGAIAVAMVAIMLVPAVLPAGKPPEPAADAPSAAALYVPEIVPQEPLRLFIFVDSGEMAFAVNNLLINAGQPALVSIRDQGRAGTEAAHRELLWLRVVAPEAIVLDLSHACRASTGDGCVVN